MGRTTGVFEGDDFVIKFLPLRAENVSARDDDVNFLGTCRDGAANFRNTIFKWGKPCRKSSRDGGDIDFCAFKCAARRFDKKVIDANSADLNVEAGDSEFPHEIVLQRLARFGAEA